MMEESVKDKYDVIIGLEVHAQLLTQSKIFNSDSTTFGNQPNVNISEITFAHPGTLPVLNKKAVEYAIKMGLACQSVISREMIFDRKNYFYPDSPKGYQITQDRTPVCVGGQIVITKQSGEKRTIKLNRIHLEEDAGKSIHLEGEEDSLIDFNRSGVPLIEIVTEPVIHSSEEAQAFLAEIRRLVRYLEICDGNMEEGSLRCDANISIMPKGASEYGKKVEVKNMNSIKNVGRAIDFEIQRQIELAEKGLAIDSETRDFNAETGITTGMRTKEELNDYRYFPDPDLSPVHVSDRWLAEIQTQMPALPWELLDKFIVEYSLPDYDANVLIENKNTAEYFQEVCTYTTNFKAVSNWLMGPIKSYLNENGLEITDLNLSAKRLADLISLVDSNKVSFSIASQRLLPALLNTEKPVIQVAEELNLIQESDAGVLEQLINDVLNEHPDKVKAYKNGKKGLLGMFVGEVMKRSRGKADPKVTNELLINKLS
ncbi:Asp-tRNA(Asn)/Glu-tRNA(Gln) amidotransferase subunit GatB [Fulvivirga lutea]|uniref:Aspartyl/glutamyl-tRNA(Asn/Gln) amidotransferase subunit B n=1 Tax=Fulvivirga lutea TaxID=2810512 RepID=A0A974WFC3_9BACT|nr:Asp-tRNA(Asn)/Glu-tRNA(Gln) amidotransferase subunit GatB [Fulvivirga lutea]QSE96694.1 Asp-tRNA(Asn)/Glu-tRNA(Gln) amidotransferase subunit GatB [Fulvivirga lutea]